MGYRSTDKSLYSATYQVIWCPKYRRRVLVGRVEARVGEIIAEVVAHCSAGARVIEVKVMADHVHLLVEIPPTVALSRAHLRWGKGRSSRLLRAEFVHLHLCPCGAVLWSTSWFVSTVGGAPLEVVRRYVENQKVAA